MKSHDFRLLGAACCAWGVVASLLRGGLSYPWMLALAALTLAAAMRGTFSQRPLALFWSLVAAVTAFLSLTTAVHEHTAESGPTRVLAKEHAVVQARLLVTKEPVPLAAKRNTAGGFLVAARLRQVRARGENYELNTPIVVIAGKSWNPIRWRDEIQVNGQLNPTQRGEQARALLIVNGAPGECSPGPWPLGMFESLRGTLRESFGHTPADPRGLSPALVDGDVSKMPSDLKEVMNEVGMSHLSAVSGSNVTIVLVASQWLVGWIRLRRRARLVTGLLTLLGFVALCHPDPSVIRAAMMGGVGVLGTSAGRPRAACPALGAAIVVLLAWEPWLAVSVGFALSSLATLGLVLFARPWTASVSSRLPSWCAKPCELTMIPLSASVPCLPVLVALNGSISLVSVPANVLAEPLVAPATLGGLAILLLGPLPLPMRTPLAWLVSLPTWGIALIARGAHQLPGGSVPWPDGFTGAGCVAVVVLIVLFAWRVARHARWWGVLIALVVAFVVLAVRTPLPGVNQVPGNWRYALCDVGQGDGGLIRTGQEGQAIAIDVGPEEADGMIRCLHRHGVRTLEAIFLSHFHADHVGALDKILTEVPVGEVFVTPVREEASGGGHGERGAAPEVDRALAQRGRSAKAIAPGQHVKIGEVEVAVLWPRRVIHEGSVQNNASLILDVQAADAHLLFLGDAEKEADSAVQSEVASYAARRPYDVVKVGHHGSSNQAPSLYSAAKARFGAIGVGADNDYGHPSKKLLRMLQSANTAPCRSDQNGEVTFTENGTGLVPVAQKSTC